MVAYYGDYFATQTTIKSLCYTKTNIMYVNYISIKTFFKNEG